MSGHIGNQEFCRPQLQTIRLTRCIMVKYTFQFRAVPPGKLKRLDYLCTTTGHASGKQTNGEEKIQEKQKSHNKRNLGYANVWKYYGQPHPQLEHPVLHPHKNERFKSLHIK